MEDELRETFNRLFAHYGIVMTDNLWLDLEAEIMEIKCDAYNIGYEDGRFDEHEPDKPAD